jgi:hypothetical protein
MRLSTQILLLVLLLVAIPALSQVEPSASGGGETSEDDTQMMTPPPVSGLPYASEGSEGGRSNYLSATIAASAGYIDNILPGVNTAPVSDETYSIAPSVSLARTTPRQSMALNYSPNFSFYEPTSVFDTVDQSASLTFSQRLSPHLSVGVQDYFMRTNDVFNEAYPFSTGGLTGSNQAPVPALIAPFSEQMSDTLSGSISYQYGLNGMIGGGGSYSNLDYPNPIDALGLYNSSGESGSAFYSKRFSRSQYGGISYSYSRYTGDVPQPSYQTQIHTISGFYTFYFNPRCSFSISGGMQHINVTIPGSPAFDSWTPSGVASIGWQGKRASLAASYLHTVYAGEGLYGAYHSDSASGSAGWNFGRTWSGSLGVSYANISSENGLTVGNNETGDTLAGDASVRRSFGDRIGLSAGYQRLHESYTGIAVIAENPDSDRVYVTVSYEFRKSLGR